jgi:hypothetical protein
MQIRGRGRSGPAAVLQVERRDLWAELNGKVPLTGSTRDVGVWGRQAPWVVTKWGTDNLTVESQLCLSTLRHSILSCLSLSVLVCLPAVWLSQACLKTKTDVVVTVAGSKIMDKIEMQFSKEVMANKEFVSEFKQSMATTLWLMKDRFGSGTICYYDSWFASVKTALALLKRGVYFCGPIKTCHWVRYTLPPAPSHVLPPHHPHRPHRPTTQAPLLTRAHL